MGLGTPGAGLGVTLQGPCSLSSSGETTRQSSWDSVSGGRTSASLCGPQGAVGPEITDLNGLGPAPRDPRPGLKRTQQQLGAPAGALGALCGPGCVKVSLDNTALLASLQPCLEFSLK